MDPGLVYDLTDEDYVSFLYAIEYAPKTIQVITRSPASCPARKSLPENLNYPSIAAMFSSATKGMSSKTFFRTVTNVGQTNAVYRLKVEPPKGVNVTVKPARLAFSETVRKLSYYVTIAFDSKKVVFDDDSGALFGSLSWTDGKHVVRSPITVTQLAPL